jgi:glycosyltransferase involved in cell wall biosynthesis
MEHSEPDKSKRPETAILHYTAPPVVGGVEAVIRAHADLFLRYGYPVTVVAGWGEEAALPSGVKFVRIPEMDTKYSLVAQMSPQLENGELPPAFIDVVDRLVELLTPLLARFDLVILHNLFTKHFNLPLTAALHHLLDAGKMGRCVAWCHDFTWTSPNSRSKVHPGFPWDLLRTYRRDVIYVVVSRRRQRELASLFGCSAEQIRVIYNGVDPETLLGLSPVGDSLVSRLGLLESDLVLLMPVRVTQAKNIEYAVKLVAALKARGCHSKLVVTGPPDPHDLDNMAYFQELRALRQRLGVEDEVCFVFESGPDADQHFIIDERVVGDLFRMSDVMFMPSHREGFGMPVLEAGLVGLPVICTNVPAAEEIGAEDAIIFDADQNPDQLAGQLLTLTESSQIYRLRRRVRQRYTWHAIFHRDIKLLLDGEGAA